MRNLMNEYDQFLRSYFENNPLVNCISDACGKMEQLQEFLVLTADYEILAMNKADELLCNECREQEKAQMRMNMASMVNEKLREFIEKKYMAS